MRLAARQASYDTRCSLCAQVILGYNGKRSEDEIMAREVASGEPHHQHPLDTLDEIVKLDGEWVHADCARDAGHQVAGI